jgi:pyrroloquinoline quinone (PQQ) biosynthesis protein C
MDNFDYVLESTADDYKLHILDHPLLAALSKGEITREHYVAYLRETYHLVGHTSKATALVPPRLDHRPDLRDWFVDVARTEQNHDQFCVKDLKALGLDPDPILAQGMGPGAWAMISQLYYMSTIDNPIGVLGVAMATEGLGADLATAYADVLESEYGIPHAATTFLRSHGVLDIRHVEEVRQGVNEIVDGEEELNKVIHARRMTIFYYGQLFSDVLNAA